MKTPPRYMYIIVALMMLIAKEDIDGMRVRDRIMIPIDKEWIV